MARDHDRCDSELVVKLAILCHPLTPAPEADLEAWLESQLEQLRETAPSGIIRLSRLAQALPDTEIGIGWLIEIELSEESVVLTRDGVADALADLFTDMRFLGLQPKVLTPHDLFDRAGDLSTDPPNPSRSAGNGHHEHGNGRKAPWPAAS